MANGAQHAAEFREIVETVLEKHKKAEADANSSLRRIRPNNTGIRAAGLVFAHILPRQSRSSVFGLRPEEMWGVADKYEHRISRHSGRMAILSSIEKPDTLLRRIEFSGSSPLIGISTARTLNEAEAAAVIEWVRSPHIYPEVHHQLAILLPEEIEKTSREFAEQSEAKARFQKDMEDVRRAMTPGPEFDTQIIR